MDGARTIGGWDAVERNNGTTPMAFLASRNAFRIARLGSENGSVAGNIGASLSISDPLQAYDEGIDRLLFRIVPIIDRANRPPTRLTTEAGEGLGVDLRNLTCRG